MTMNRPLKLHGLLFAAFFTFLNPSVPAFAGETENALSLVPNPAVVERIPGKFLIDPKTPIAVDAGSPALKEIGKFLASRLRESTGYSLPLDTAWTGMSVKGAPDPIVLSIAPHKAAMAAEGYELSVAKTGIRIRAGGAAGAFYALQTLFQLLPVEFEYGSHVSGVAWEVPCVRVQDAPRFPWRGMHLDVGRHFFGKKFVEEYIDLISRYKFNIFHWHLTEDQGWRIEIRKYPKLTSVGAWRKETLDDGQPYGGFYTQDEIREVVAYARQRFVTIVPEIEMPGHSTAAIASYPELSCTGGPFEVQTKWRVFEDVYCAGNDRTFEFLQDVLTEVMDLFPGQFIHVGGDECPKTRWKVCPRCQARIKAEGLAGEHELQSYFVKRIEKFLNAHGKRLVGWDEILEGGLAPNATVMSWRGIDGGIAAAASGHDVVMSPTSNCYFDYFQGLTGEPDPVGKYLPLDSVYGYEPVPASLTADQARHILGAQGNVWTEYIADAKKAWYMSFPRACAMSEVVWSPGNKRDFQDFSARMADQYERLAARGVNVRIPPPSGFEGDVVLFRDTAITLINQVPGSVVRYTTDGSVPSGASRSASGAIPIRTSTVVKAVTILPSGGMSPVPRGVYSIVDPNVNGVSWKIVPRRVSSGIRVDTASGFTYRMSLEGLPLGPDSLTVTLETWLDVGTEGIYTFWVGQGDPATLGIDGFSPVENRGANWWDIPSGIFHLRTGEHRLTVTVITPGPKARLDLHVQGPGLEMQPIPASMLRRRPH